MPLRPRLGGGRFRASVPDIGDDPAAVAVQNRMYRALVVLRLVVLANQVGLHAVRSQNFEHPRLGLVCVAVMVVWTGFAIWAYAVPRRRRLALLVADLLVATALMAATPYVKGPGFEATIPGFWVTGALIAWAIHWRWVGGLVAAVVISAVDLSFRSHIDQGNYGNVFLIVIAGAIVGYVCESIQGMAVERDRAERAAATAAERARLARVVHDGVLQVLALTQRRGAEAGGDAELGRLAAEQEAALRSLIRQQDSLQTVPGSGTAEDLDLTPALEECGSGRSLAVHVVTPGTPVLVEAHAGAELLAVVGACLDNVSVHVGDTAPVWLLLEDTGSAVMITVRDEGPGFEPGRLAEAAAAGRLGVSESIQGRMRDLGGSAEVFSGPGQGTEWELTLPRR